MKTPQAANMIVGANVGEINDGTAQVSTFAGQAQNNVKVIQQSGISSIPSGAVEAVLGSINGSSSRRVTLVVINPDAPDAPRGETWVYSADTGSIIKIRPEGVEIEAANLTWNGRRVAVEGDSTTDGATIL